MPQEDFVAKLMQTSPGREVLAAQEEKVRARRRDAAKKLAASNDLDDTIKQIDADLQKTTAEIKGLATKLKTAQERQGELSRDRLRALNELRFGLNKARTTLTATAPSELIAIADLARLAEHSARFQLRQRAPLMFPIGRDASVYDQQSNEARVRWEASRLQNKALLDRAREVLAQVDVLIVKADLEPVDIENVSRLRVFLNAPPELLIQISGVTSGE
jgi:hypothetical protein